MSAKPEKPPELKYTKLHEPDIELALQHDALRYVHDTSAGVLPVRPLVRYIVEQAPSVKDAINAKLFANIGIKKPPVLLNMIDDFQSRIEEYHGETARHVRGVVDLTAMATQYLVNNQQLTEKQRLTPEQGADLCLASALHDYGKLYVPLEILDYPYALPPVEKAIMNRHIVYSARILDLAAAEEKDIHEIVSGHHEKLNKSGYPRGLGVENLSYTTRILPVLDIFATMIEGRSFRTPVSEDKAIQNLYEDADKGLIDRDIVALLEKDVLRKFAQDRARKEAGTEASAGITPNKSGGTWTR